MKNKASFSFVPLLALCIISLYLCSCCRDDTEQGIYYKDRDKISLFNLTKDSISQYRSSYPIDTIYYPTFNYVCDTALFEDYQLLVDFDDTYYYNTSQCQAFSFSFFPKAMAMCYHDDRDMIVYNNAYPIQYVDSVWVESLTDYNADYSANSDITPAVSFLMYSSGYYYGSRNFNNQEVNYDSLLYFLNEGYEGFHIKLDELPDNEKDVQFVVHVSLDTDTVLLDTTRRIYMKLD